MFNTRSLISRMTWVWQSPFQGFWQGRMRLYLSLAAGLLLSAMALVYIKHQHRNYYAELQSLQQTRDALHVTWSQLMLEQGALTTNARVERLAREKLNMISVPHQEVVIIKP